MSGSQGEALHAELRKLVADHPEVYVEARGRGLMAGLKLADRFETRQVVDFVRERGLLTVAAGENVVRMAPPLIIGRAEIDEAVALLRAAAEELMAEERDVA